MIEEIKTIEDLKNYLYSYKDALNKLATSPDFNDKQIEMKAQKDFIQNLLRMVIE